MRIKHVLSLLFFVVAVFPVSAQQIAVKTNLLYDATRSINVGAEVGVAPKWTIDLSADYNPWSYSTYNKMKHILIQPEARYWFCEQFNGHFIGIHAHWAKFNVAGIELPFGIGNVNSDNRYQGDLYGMGFSYGYQWLLGEHWNIEASLGVGYAYIDYDKYPCAVCGTRLKDGHTNYFGPTKAAISIVYLF